jgi:hypothetical protein
MAIAMRDSVTVSIGEEIRGILMLMLRDTIVEVPTPEGITSDLPGINKTSS